MAMKIFQIWESNTNQYINNHNGFFEFVSAASHKIVDSYDRKTAKEIIDTMKSVDQVIATTPGIKQTEIHNYVMQEITLDQIRLTDHELSTIIKKAMTDNEDPSIEVNNARLSKVQTSIED